jgi:hypothetical protein
VRSLALLLALASCFDQGSARARVVGLCGEPPPIVGVPGFSTYITGREYSCATPSDDRQRTVERRAALKWEECALDALDAWQ